MSKLLAEERNDLVNEYETIISAGKTEERALTEEELAILKSIEEKVDAIDKTIKAEETLAEMEELEVKEDDTPTEEDVNVEETRAIDEVKAFADYLRGEVNERTGEITTSTGGALIPSTVADMIVKKVYDISPILERSQKFNVKGKIEVPYYPASSDITVDYRSEFSALSSTSGTFSAVELGGFLAGALTKISLSLINKSEFDIVGFVVEEMAYQIARWLEGEMLNGTDSKIEGLSTLTNGVTTASASAITSDEIIQLHDKVKDIYQADAIWIMSPATRTAVRLLQTTDGKYLLNDDVSTPFGASILGKPVYVSDQMDDIAGGKTVIYYGDMKGLATKFAEDINVQVMREKYLDEHAVGVVGWVEADGKVINEQKLAKLTMHSA